MKQNHNLISRDILNDILHNKRCRFKESEHYKKLSQAVIHDVDKIISFSEETQDKIKKEIDRFTWEEVTRMVDNSQTSAQLFYQRLYLRISDLT